MFFYANSIKNEPHILELKQRLETGNIEENITKELNRLRELKQKFPQNPPIDEIIYISVNYIFGNLKRLQAILAGNIRTQPIGDIFLNSVQSHERVISYMLDKKLIDLDKFKQEIEIFKIGFPDDKVTKFSERALNNYLAKTTITTTSPIPPPHFTGTLTQEQLNKLYTGLTTAGYLPTDSTGGDYKAFVYIFAGKGEPEDFKPLKWEKSKGLLAYFIDLLCYSFKKKGQRAEWKFAEIAFNVKNLRGAKNDYQKIGQLPIGHEAIDNLIKHL